MSIRTLLKDSRNKGWTIKIIPRVRKEVAVLHFSLLDLFRLGFIGCLTLLVVVGYFLVQRTQELHALRDLKNSLEIREQQLQTVQKEKAHVETLLDREASKLEMHLGQLRKQEEEIRNLLNRRQTRAKVPSKKVAFESGKQAQLFQYGQKSSRGTSYSQLGQRLAALENRIETEQSALLNMKQAAVEERKRMEEERRRLMALFERVPSLWPADGYITSGFGYRVHPIGGEGEFHSGIDIATNYAAPIRAAGGGICVFAGYKSGFGYTVQVDHGNGLVSQYSHCSQVLVREGAAVKKGAMVALVGSTGYSTGPHVHYQLMYRGALVNPSRYLGLTVDDLVSQGGLAGLFRSN